MSYEFSEAQNQKFRKLTRSMNRVVILLFLVGLNALIQYYFDVVEYQRNLTLLLEGLAYLLFSVMVYLPISRFKKIFTTSGRDVEELMGAFNVMSRDWFWANVSLGLIVIVESLKLFDGTTF
jgi:hypothetical protein